MPLSFGPELSLPVLSPPLLSLVAGAAATVAVALLVQARAPTPQRRSPPRRGWWLVGAAVVLFVSSAVSTQAGAVLMLLAGSALGLRTLWSRRRRRRQVEAGQDRVAQFCQLLGAELAAGQPPGVALERASLEWPDLQPVGHASRLGGDVPDALRLAAGTPGQGDLVLVAAAWQVAHRSGTGLTTALQRVSAGLRATGATRRLVQAELASARATARLLAALPVLALLTGRGIGGDPLTFLLGSGWGWSCLAAGLALGFAGLWWIEAIADSVTAGGP